MWRCHVILVKLSKRSSENESSWSVLLGQTGTDCLLVLNEEKIKLMRWSHTSWGTRNNVRGQFVSMELIKQAAVCFVLDYTARTHTLTHHVTVTFQDIGLTFINPTTA